MTSRLVGVDVGGTKVLGVAVDAAGAVVAEVRRPTPPGDQLVDLVAGVVEELGPPTAVGVGLPGLVDRGGVLRSGPHLTGVTDLPVRAVLAGRLGVPVVVGNDATLALHGERRRGSARGADDVLLLTFGTGIGAGLLLGGRTIGGVNGFAGEVGHQQVVPEGRPCPCGRRGCWERYASGAALDAAVTSAAAAGDLAALATVDAVAQWIAVGTGNLVLTLDVELVVLGGGMVGDGSVLLEPVRRAYDTWAAAGAPRPPVRIAVAQLGERAGAIGAALLAGEDS